LGFLHSPRRLSIALIAAASTIALTQIASAADLPRKAPVYVPPPVADWSGVYVGLEGGYGWAKESFDNFNPFFSIPSWEPGFDRFPTIGSVNQRAWLFDGFAGVQKQWGSWVLGIEADFDAANIKGSAESSTTQSISGVDGNAPTTVTRSVTVDSKIDELGSVRGKVGFVPAPDWLIYGTGGLAFAHLKNTVTLSETVNYKGSGMVINELNTASASGGASMFGWAAGAGVDWKFWHDAGSAWILGVEYLHYGFGDHTITLADNSSGHTATAWDIAFNSKQSVDTIKGRISYLFSIH
jgi:outer membrane immunogenic protein